MDKSEEQTIVNLIALVEFRIPPLPMELLLKMPGSFGPCGWINQNEYWIGVCRDG